MARVFALKEQLSFRVTFAKLWHGNGPFDGLFPARPDDDAELNAGHPILYLELESRRFRRLLGKRPATALIHRHPTGEEQTGTGISARGELQIGEYEEGPLTCVHVFGLLPPEPFDAIASALITGGREILSRCRLQVGLMKDRDEIDFDKREGPLKDALFLIGDLAITFEIGDRYDEFSEDEK